MRGSNLQERMLKTALGRKAYANNRSKRVEREGEYKPLWTWHGPIHRVHGEITCYYHGSRVLAIDFINSRTTDFGMHGYSVSTGPNINKWEDAVRRVMKLPRSYFAYNEWTYRHCPRKFNTNYDKFRQGVDWLWRDYQGKWWFCWKLYRHWQAEQFRDSVSFLYDDQNWRYFEYDWDEIGTWARRFKDADAERKWNQRDRKRTLARTRSISSSFSSAEASQT